MSFGLISDDSEIYYHFLRMGPIPIKKWVGTQPKRKEPFKKSINNLKKGNP